MKNSTGVCLIFFYTIFLALNVYSQEEISENGALPQKRNVNGVLVMELAFGGEKMITVEYENGDTNNIRAGENLQLAGGVVFQTAPEISQNLETQMTIGWKFKKLKATNGDVSWDRFPIEVIQFFKKEKFRIGAGFTYHINPKYDASTDLPDFPNGELTFDNAMGMICEADYLITEKLVCGVKATVINYTYRGLSCNGDSIGIVCAIKF